MVLFCPTSYYNLILSLSLFYGYPLHCSHHSSLIFLFFIFIIFYSQSKYHTLIVITLRNSLLKPSDNITHSLLNPLTPHKGEDLERNDGSTARPYYMTSELHDILMKDAAQTPASREETIQLTDPNENN